MKQSLSLTAEKLESIQESLTSLVNRDEVTSWAQPQSYGSLACAKIVAAIKKGEPIQQSHPSLEEVVVYAVFFDMKGTPDKKDMGIWSCSLASSRIADLSEKGIEDGAQLSLQILEKTNPALREMVFNNWVGFCRFSISRAEDTGAATIIQPDGVYVSRLSVFPREGKKDYFRCKPFSRVSEIALLKYAPVDLVLFMGKVLSESRVFRLENALKSSESADLPPASAESKNRFWQQPE